MEKEDNRTVIEMQKIFNKHNTGLRLGKREFDAINEIIALSLPQEQKDKVTGVTDEEIEKLWEENSVLNNMMGQSFRLMHKEEFVKILKSLLSSKAVEQKGPDGWVCDDMFSTNKDKCIYLQEYYKLDDDIKPVYFSPPISPNSEQIRTIQEAEHKPQIDWDKYVEDLKAEHKQGVTDKDLFNLMGRFYFQLESAKDDEAQQIYEVYGKQLRSLFGEKGKEGKDE